ncbi:MAG TPA: ABC transporter permease, partial [Trueperaceae bacterium]|nr:ABC transporter permease [Trueperaceae bacterium]
MRFGEIITTAIGNAFRSKLRTILTILAIFVGAFTLTLTNGVGTGVTRYIDAQVSSLGENDVMLVSQASNSGGGFGDTSSGPTPYDPDKAVVAGQGGPQFAALTRADLTTIG